MLGRDIIAEAVGDYDLRNGKNLRVPSMTAMTIDAAGLVTRYSDIDPAPLFAA